MATPTVVTGGVGVHTSNGSATASLAAGAAGSRRMVLVAFADSAGAPTAMAVTGGSVTFAAIPGTSATDYRTRRRVEILVSDGAASAGALTLTATVPNTFQETYYYIYDIPNVAGTPFGDGLIAVAGASVTTLSLASLGSIGANDFVIFIAGEENASDNLDVAAGSTRLDRALTGGSVRSSVTGYSTSDDTPGVGWTTSSDDGEVGMVGVLCYTTAGSAAAVTADVGALTVVGYAPTASVSSSSFLRSYLYLG